MNQVPYTIGDQVSLLRSKGLLIADDSIAAAQLGNISYYRLKGYWLDLLTENLTDKFVEGTRFEDVMDRYDFDRQLRGILFAALENIEVALRTKMIQHLSSAHGGLWYMNSRLFDNKMAHQKIIANLYKEFDRSHEPFVLNHKLRYPGSHADIWKILEVSSFGALSKLYKSLSHQLPAKALIAKEFGLNFHSELSSWLESINYIRNLVAHHSRLWSRKMIKRPLKNLKKPKYPWLSGIISEVDMERPFLIICCVIYLCDSIIPEHETRIKLLDLFQRYSNLPIHKMGFCNNWKNQPIWLKNGD